jgi:SsrA-binding protein
MKVLAVNRRARYDYQIEDQLVAGLALTGAETKSAKLGHASLKGSFVQLRNGEAWLMGSQFTKYQGNKDQDPTRVRKLLLHRKELDGLAVKKREGFSIVPTALVQDGRYVKLELGVGRGKKQYDKRRVIKEREAAREAARRVVR